jgi:HPt (histidine-containing phosphotransfer) domain-containing protein
MEKTSPRPEKETSTRIASSAAAAPAPSETPTEAPAATAAASTTAASPANPESLAVINWEEAMTQVGGEVEFLEEILQDLLDEAQTAEDDILAGINTKDFDRIMKAAHRIKGSATYLGCEALRVTAYAIQQLGQTGTKNPNEGLWDKINEEYALFLTALQNLRAEITRWKSEPK